MPKALNCLLLSSLFFLPLSGSIVAQTFDEPMRVNTDHDGGIEQGGPILRIGNDGKIYIAWVDFRDNAGGDLYLRVSDNGGATFGPERVIYSGESIPEGMGRGTNVVVAPDGTIHVVWLEVTGQAMTDVKYIRSTDGGVSFSEPRLVVGDDGGAAQDFPSMAVDSNGAVVIAWVDGRDRKRGTDEFDQIYMTRSTDGGVTFSTPKQASYYFGGRGGSCECCNTSTAIGPDGDILIAYRSNIDNIRDIYVARSRDGGETFENAIRMPSESWNVFACPMAGPTIGIDREGTAHVLWKDNRSSAGGKQLMYYATLYNDAFGPTRDLPVSATARQTNYPSIDFLPSGAMVTTFEDFSANKKRALYYSSGDGGNSFVSQSTTVTNIAQPNQEMPIVAVAGNGTRHLVWQDDRRGAGDIWYARDDSPIPTTLPEQVRLLTPEDGEVLLPQWSLSWTQPTNLLSGNVRYTVSIESANPNVTPIEFNTQSPTMVPELSDGTYFWSVTARTLVGSSEPSETRSFTVGESSGVLDGGNARLQIAPNPVHRDGGATLFLASEGNDGSSDVRIVLVDLLGREIGEVFHGSRGSSDLRLSIPTIGVAAGIYSLIIEEGSARMVKRLIVVD